MAKWKQNRDSPLSTYKIWTEVMKTHKKKKGNQQDQANKEIGTN